MPPRARAAPAAVAEADASIFEGKANPLAQIPTLFSASQHSVATHRKNINTLHAVFLKAAAVTTPSPDGTSVRLTGEKLFGEAFRAAVIYPLGVKKGVEQADRLVKFIAGFVGFAVEYDAKKREATDEEDDDDDVPSSRLVAQLLAFLLKGFQAKNKIARFRCVQLVALMVNSLGEIDDDSYQHLKEALLDRVRDKEATVRMQAVVALSKLQGADAADSSSSSDGDSDAESSASSAEDSQKVSTVLVDVLTHDPAADVRRAALFNLLPSPFTLPALLLRTLDIDPVNRRAAYAHVLSDVPVLSLTRDQREEVVSRGLKDREEGVRKAAGKLVAKWADDVGGVVKLLQLFDLNDEAIAEKALVSIFEAKPDLVESIHFGVDFYKVLTPATSFLARVYFQHLRASDDPRLADLELDTTGLALCVEHEWTKLVVLLEAEERDDVQEASSEFVVGQLLGIVANAEGDEIGRRKMSGLMSNILAFSSLPPSLIPKCLDVLSQGTSEREFMRIVVEIVQNLRTDSALITSESEGDVSDAETQAGGPPSDDGASDAGGRRRAKGKGKAKAREPRGEGHGERVKELDLRCLSVVKALLERVMGALQDNSSLHGVIYDVIVPAVKSKDHEVRAEGVVCLGLCCLLDKAMAQDSFPLIARQSQDAEGPLKVKALQIVFDMLILHGMDFGADRKFGPDVILGFLVNSLSQEDPEVLATAVVGISKLMLSGMITDEEILNHLVLVYFATETADNHELRQCLSYFIPVYCYSNPKNQRRLGNIFLQSLTLLKGMYDELDDKTAMVTPLQIGQQLIDWTDPQKAVQSNNVEPDESIQFDLADGMIKLLYDDQQQKDDRKLICQLLPKLYIPEEIDDLKIKGLLVLISSLKLNRPLTDTVSRNALVRFESALLKTFGERIKALTDEEINAAVAVQAVRDFIAKEDCVDLNADAEEEEPEEGGAEPEDAEDEA